MYGGNNLGILSLVWSVAVAVLGAMGIMHAFGGIGVGMALLLALLFIFLFPIMNLVLAGFAFYYLYAALGWWIIPAAFIAFPGAMMMLFILVGGLIVMAGAKNKAAAAHTRARTPRRAPISKNSIDAEFTEK